MDHTDPLFEQVRRVPLLSFIKTPLATRSGWLASRQPATANVFRMALVLALAALTSGCSRLVLLPVNLSDGRPPGDTRTAIFDRKHDLSLEVLSPAPQVAEDASNIARPKPIVVFFYGGAWQGGSREEVRFVGEAFADQGIVAVLPEYRTSPQVQFPAFAEDAAAAVAWTLDHASELGGDGAPVFVSGHSAGAHLAALVGTDASYLRQHGHAPNELAGVIGVAGAYDFLPLTDPAIKQAFGPESGWPGTQPVTFVDGDEPPFLLLQGSTDKRVWLRNSESLAAHLRKAGIPVSVRVYPDVGHSGILLAYRFTSMAPTLADSLEFIQQRSLAHASSE